MHDDEPPGECAPHGPGVEHLLDGVTMCRSVTLYAARGWFDASVDLAVARAQGHGWDRDQATCNAVERLRATLYTAADTFADMKLAAGAEARIQ